MVVPVVDSLFNMLFVAGEEAHSVEVYVVVVQLLHQLKLRISCQVTSLTDSEHYVSHCLSEEEHSGQGA